MMTLLGDAEIWAAPDPRDQANPTYAVSVCGKPPIVYGT